MTDSETLTAILQCLSFIAGVLVALPLPFLLWLLLRP